MFGRMLHSPKAWWLSLFNCHLMCWCSGTWRGEQKRVDIYFFLSLYLTHKITHLSCACGFEMCIYYEMTMKLIATSHTIFVGRTLKMYSVSNLQEYNENRHFYAVIFFPTSSGIFLGVYKMANTLVVISFYFNNIYWAFMMWWFLSSLQFK